MISMMQKRILVSVNHLSKSFIREMDKVEDLYEDMERLNMLYEEMCWANDVRLEFKADYENNRIIIKPRSEKLDTGLS